MGAIVDILKGFVDLIVGLVDFVIDLFMDLVFVIGLLGQFVLEIPTYFLWLPDQVLSVVVVGFSIVVIYMILNRK